MPGGALSSDDHLKLFYAAFSLAGNKARVADVAQVMGIKTGACGMRWNALMKKCKAKFGDVEESKFVGGGEEDTDTATPPATPAKRQRGKGKKSTGEPTPKKEDVEGEVDEEDKGEPSAKKAKVDAEAGISQVKDEPEA